MRRYRKGRWAKVFPQKISRGFWGQGCPRGSLDEGGRLVMSILPPRGTGGSGGRHSSPGGRHGGTAASAATRVGGSAAQGIRPGIPGRPGVRNLRNPLPKSANPSACERILSLRFRFRFRFVFRVVSLGKTKTFPLAFPGRPARPRLVIYRSRTPRSGGLQVTHAPRLVIYRSRTPPSGDLQVTHATVW